MAASHAKGTVVEWITSDPEPGWNDPYVAHLSRWDRIDVRTTLTASEPTIRCLGRSR